MVDVHVVGLAVEYLDECQRNGQVATLVGMYWHIDGRNKTMPLLSEVNDALAQRPQFFVSCPHGAVVFSVHGTERVVTADDMRVADGQYRAEFAKEWRRSRSDA